MRDGERCTRLPKDEEKVDRLRGMSDGKVMRERVR